MRRLAILLALLPTIALGQTPSQTLLSFVTDHCIRNAPPSVLYALPSGWTAVSPRSAIRWSSNLAVEEGIDYAAFITYQVEVSKEVDAARAWPLTQEAYAKELRNQRGYTADNWQRLFVHDDSGAHLVVSAGEDTDDPEDGYPPTCYLWHPDRKAALADAIIDRFDVPFGDRLITRLGQATLAWNQVVLDGKESTLETRVIRPDVDFADNLAPVILKLYLRD